MLGRLLARLHRESPTAMKDFTEITLCPEALDHSKVRLGVGVPPRGPHLATRRSPGHAPHGATCTCSPAD